MISNKWTIEEVIKGKKAIAEIKYYEKNDLLALDDISSTLCYAYIN